MNSNDLNSSLRHVTGDHRPEYCHQCGKCSSGCPVASFFDFRPRRIVGMVQLGIIEELLKSEDIWKCAQCLACKERCPRDVAPYDVIQALQNLAFERNLPFPKGYSTLINSILKNGVVQEPTRVKIWKRPTTIDTIKKDFEFGDRTSLSLPEPRRPDEIAKFAQALKKAMIGEEK